RRRTLLPSDTLRVVTAALRSAAVFAHAELRRADTPAIDPPPAASPVIPTEEKNRGLPTSPPCRQARPSLRAPAVASPPPAEGGAQAGRRKMRGLREPSQGSTGAPVALRLNSWPPRTTARRTPTRPSRAPSS